MQNTIFVPSSLRVAGFHLRQSIGKEVSNLPKSEFLKAWNSIAYLYPGLHPDGFDEEGSGWPQLLQKFAEEACHRAEKGELEECELYPCDAQWAGLTDKMSDLTVEELARRTALRLSSGEIV